jgi:hypothetical protein
MNRLLILSDRYLILSDDETAETLPCCLAQTPPPIGARIAVDGAGAARHVGRNLQALRSSKLSLCGRTRAWSQAVPVHQSAWWATATRLRAQQCASAGRRIDRQSPQDTRHAQRDLRDQCRAPAPTRGPGVDRDGSGARQPQRRRSGRYRRGYDCILSRRRRLAVRRGGRQ